MRTDQELKELARKVISGTVVLSSTVPPELLQNVFMPLVFMEKDQIDALRERNPVALYGEAEHAIPRTINGYPIFGKFSELSKDEYDKLREFHTELVAWEKGEK